MVYLKLMVLVSIGLCSSIVDVLVFGVFVWKIRKIVVCKVMYEVCVLVVYVFEKMEIV